MELGPLTTAALKKAHDIQTILDSEWPEERVLAIKAMENEVVLLKEEQHLASRLSPGMKTYCRITGEKWDEYQEICASRVKEAEAKFQGMSPNTHRLLSHQLYNAFVAAAEAFKKEHGSLSLPMAFRQLHRL